MPHRLTRLYTRTGDDGTTGLADGSRLDKDSPRIEAIGTLARAAGSPEVGWRKPDPPAP